MSTNKLDETLRGLDLDSSANEVKEQVISQSMNNLKSKLSGLDIHVQTEAAKVVKIEPTPRYEKTELADVARDVYRKNINPLDKKAVEDKSGKDMPSTIASRANVIAISRSLAGMRSSGNEGKTSFVGPNGTGNEGKLSPTGVNGSGNVTNNVNNYYALTTDMTLEEYEAYVQNIFEGDDCDCQHEKAEKTKKEIKARGGPPGKPDPSVKKEDVVYELENRLVTMGSTDWIVVDQILREMAQELDVTPRTISREFKSVHGVYPDKWIKENLEVEVCGYMPLEEAARLNKVGGVYEVTFMFRGGTNRLKFFWPSPGTPSKEDMQREVEKFWPKAKLIAFYPTIDNTEQSNFMVCAPPMTENYHFMQPDDWNQLSEEASMMLEMIYEEEGEPVSPVISEENGISVYVEDHDTGEQRQVLITEEGLRDWFGNSKSKDGKSGWVNVVTGDSCASDKPGEGVPKCVSSSKRSSMSEAERKASAAKKRRDDPGQQSKSGASKPTNVKTDVKEELLDEESDKKGKGSGSKDACYHKVKSRYSVWPSAYASGALVKCRQKGAKNWGNSSKKEEVEYTTEGLTGERQKRAREMQDSDIKRRGGRRTDADRDTAFRLGTGTGPGRVGDRERKGASEQGKGNAAKRRMNEEDLPGKPLEEAAPLLAAIPALAGKAVAGMTAKGLAAGAAKAGGGIAKAAGTGLGKAAVKGGANFAGRKASNKVQDLMTNDNEQETVDEACWKGYEKKGMKTMFGKRYPNCVKKEDYKSDKKYQAPDLPKKTKKERDTEDYLKDLSPERPAKGGKNYLEQAECPICGEDPCQCLEGTISEGSPAWQKKEGKSESGGLNQKGVDSYKAANPGSKLKTAVTKDPSKLKKGGKAAGRRKSFCSRMKGMKSKLTSAKTANDPDSRINKSLRKWNC